ncbi:hypothetical protein U9R80_16720 [Pseudomonas sp. JQ170C]|uniref:hypothetical protein n=1 Tax=unclassified Pseudomonas TaxID=196821 RepID=UPI002659A374|nr:MULTISPECIES: hypothetical protein [unclassified Pseudomonas]WRO74166.1 hypothetical protein U9R80_16720 [Pseudomonas sp. 170C]
MQRSIFDTNNNANPACRDAAVRWLRCRESGHQTGAWRLSWNANAKVGDVLHFLDLIAFSEGASAVNVGDDGYNVLCGRGLVTGYLGHPRRKLTFLVNGKSVPSTAALFQRGMVAVGTVNTGAGVVVHGVARGELVPAAAQRIVAIAGDGDQGLIALQACQAYVREVTKETVPILSRVD